MLRTHVVVHHSLTADGPTVSWQAIRRYHVQVRGWHDIGYHAGLELVNDEREALLGRPLDHVAAACPEGRMNTLGLHVCCVGNFDLLAPSDELLQVLADRVVGPWCRTFDIPPARVVGHRDFNPARTCPGKLFDLDALRARL